MAETYLRNDHNEPYTMAGPYRRFLGALGRRGDEVFVFEHTLTPPQALPATSILSMMQNAA